MTMRYDIRVRLRRLWNDEGGWVGAAIAGAGLLGKLFSGGAKGSAEGRQKANENAILQDRMRAEEIASHERALQDRRALDMKQREMDSGARDMGYRQALRSQYLQGWTPAQRPDGIQMIRGGFNTIPQSAKDLAKDFERQALIKALQGEKFADLPALERFKPTAMKEPSMWEKVSGALGLGMQGAGAIGGMFGKGKNVGTGEDDGFDGGL
jgi:hypothetical protein